MKPGRPKGTTNGKLHKSYYTAGRYAERVERVRRKKEKLDMTEFLLGWWQEQPELTRAQHDYIKKLAKRADELRSQISVYSTHCA